MLNAWFLITKVFQIWKGGRFTINFQTDIVTNDPGSLFVRSARNESWTTVMSMWIMSPYLFPPNGKQMQV